MRKIALGIMIIISIAVLSSCGNRTDNSIVETNSSEQSQKHKEQTMTNDKLKLEIGDVTLTATLENNESVEAFKKLMKDGNFKISFSKYGGFEQVGSLGTSIPSNDTQISTVPGDIVLYSGNQLVLFYDSHSWSYTKIGKIDGVSSKELKKLLGKSDVDITFSLLE